MGIRTIVLGTTLAVAACGGGTVDSEIQLAATPPPTSTVAPAPTTAPIPVASDASSDWSVEQLPGPTGADLVSAIGTDGAVVVAAASDDGAVGVWVDRGEGFDTASSAPVSRALRPTAALALAHGGFLLALRTPDEGSQIWRSADGAIWTVAPELTPDGDVEIADLVAVDDGFVAVGLRFTSDPEALPFDPAIWVGDAEGIVDVTPAETVGLPGYGFVAAIERVGERLLAVGAVADSVSGWWSDDGGVSWSTADLSSAFPERWLWAADLAVVEDHVVVSSTSAEELFVRRSDDSTTTWQSPDGLGVNLTSGELSAAGGSFWLAGSRHHGRADLERCYIDLTGCDEPVPVVLRSDDGGTWDEIDFPMVIEDQLWPQVVAESAGTVRFIGPSRTDAALISLTWEGAGDPPTRPLAGPLADDGPRVARTDDELTVGETVRFPLPTHCGIGILGRFNGRTWFLDGSPGGLPSPSPDDAWPSVGESVLGLATLVDERTIEYSLTSGELIATYRASDDQPFICD